MSNTSYCAALGIQRPSLEAVREYPAADVHSLLIVALLERGEPMSLAPRGRKRILDCTT